MSLLILLSPTKKQARTFPDISYHATQPQCARKSAILVDILKNLSPSELAQQLDISAKLGELNYNRYQSFDVNHYTKDNGSPCLWTFQGDVYRMLDANTLGAEEIDFAQNHLRILSGLYGVLRPCDLIQLYRLDMGARIGCGQHKNLYDFWGNEITDVLKKDAPRQLSCIVNLASKEYARAIVQDRLDVPMVEIMFRQERQAKLHNIGLLAKRARGQMARFMIKERFNDISKIKSFNIDGYQYNASLSNASQLTFVTKAL